jgi:hypothetical protein
MNKKICWSLVALAMLSGCKESSDSRQDKALIELELFPVTELMSGDRRTAIAPLGYPTEFKAMGTYNDGSILELESVDWDHSDGLRIDEQHLNVFWAYDRQDNMHVSANYSDQNASHRVEVQALNHNAFDVSGSSIMLVGVPGTHSANFLFNEPTLPNKKLDVTKTSQWYSNNTDVVTIRNGVATPVAQGTATLSAVFDENTMYEESEFSVEVIAFDDIEKVNLELDVGFSNPEDNSQRVLLQNLPEELEAKLIIERSGDVFKVDVSNDVVWSAEGNCVIDNGYLVTKEVGIELNDCQVSGTYSNSHIDDILEENITLTTLGKSNFSDHLVVECNDNPFYGSTDCEALLTVTKGNLSEVLHVREIAEWKTSNYLLSVDNKGSVTSTSSGQSADITAELTLLDPRNPPQGKENLMVGLPVDNIEIAIKNGSDEFEIIQDGQLALIAKSDGSDVSSLVDWHTTGSGWAIDENGLVTVKTDGEETADVIATYKYDSNIQDIVTINKVDLLACENSDQYGLCLHVNQDELGNDFVSNPNVLVTQSLGFSTESEYETNGKLFALVNWGEANAWCDTLSSMGFNGKSWSLPTESALKSLQIVNEDMTLIGWATSFYQYWSTTAFQNTTSKVTVSLVTGDTSFKRTDEDFFTSYVSCISN